MAETQTPDYSSPDFTRFCPLWDKVDACLGGTEAMRASVTRMPNGKLKLPYLLQFPMEAEDSYEYRIDTSTFLPAYGDGLNRIVGAITRKPPTLSADVPPNIAADWDNIDNAGTKWAVKAQQLLRTGVHHGAAYVLVEMPKRPVPDNEDMDASQSAAANFRPFAVLYSAKELANWPRYVVIDGAPVLQLIVFCEQAVELDDFGEVSKPRYRVWRLPVEKDEVGNHRRAGNAEWEIWGEDEAGTGKKKKKQLVIKDQGVSPFADIPVAVFNANPCLTDPTQTEGPVLIDLANENIKHYNLTSDHEKILHKCTPILTTVNLRESEANLGGVAGLDVRLDCDEGGGASYTEAPGSSLAERREWIALLEKHLHEMGASLFTEGSQKSGMTATEVRERGGSQQSRISQIADAWHDCLENVLIWFARWKGEEPKGAIIPGVKASDLVVTPADLPALSQMVERGQHSRKTLWAIEKKLGILLDDFSDDQEYQNLEDEQRRLGGAAGAQLDRLLNGPGIE